MNGENAEPATDRNEKPPYEDSAPDDSESPSNTRLPALLKHAATARESDAAKRERLADLGGNRVSGATEAARIRYAPPPTDPHKITSTPITFPPLAGCTKHAADTTETLRVLQEMETELSHKQTETARFFRVLYDLQTRSSSASMKSLLQQISALLFRATYQLTEPEGEGDESEGSTAPSNNDLAALDPSALETLRGREYFSLYTHAQHSLEVVTSAKQQLETKLQLEQALESDLVSVHRQLEQDLHVIRSQHLEHHEHIEAERAAVARLESDHASLLQHEQQLQKECDGLSQQAERHHTQLSELQSKSAYLDFISRIPLKKHLEQKKLQEQEARLLAVVTQEEAENALLEKELAALNEQLTLLDKQFEKDVAHRAMLGNGLVDAEQMRDAAQREHERVRACHTPRPAWDEIVERIPELSNHDDIEWDEMQAALSHAPGILLQRAGEKAAARRDGNQRLYRDLEDDDNDEDSNASGLENQDSSEEDDASEIGGRTQELVGEILQWIERLQKHCGVNLHLSRIWHDVEEARVELHILQRQLDQAVRKCTRFGGVRGGRAREAAAAAGGSRPKQEYICALGVHAEIPLFLRHQGKVKRHALKKSELEAIARNVWTEKRRRERRNPHLKLLLEDILYEKLYRKYGFQPLIAEWGYNILLSLDLYSWDAELDLFLLCLTRAISDQVFLDQEFMLEKCASLLLRLSESYGNEIFASERRVLLKDALVALRKFFPLKTSAQLQALEKAMIRDMHKMKRGGNDSILYIDDILARTARYPRGFFVKAVRQQHFKEIQDYYATLTAELETRDEHKTGELPLHHVHEAMLAVDPLADAAAVWSALMRGVGVKTRAQLVMHDVVPYKAFLRQMNTTGLLKFALNFDAQTEISWHRLHRSTDASSRRRSSIKSRKASVLAARSQSITTETSGNN